MIPRTLISGLSGLVFVFVSAPLAGYAAPQASADAAKPAKVVGDAAAGNGQKPKAAAKASGKQKEKQEPKPDATSREAEPAADAPADAQTAEQPGGDDDEAAAENAEAETAAVARPVSADPVQIYGWREYVAVQGVEGKLRAKLDTGALTSSIHAEEQELFERDGKKWVRFIVTDPTVEKPVRTRLEAPLVRVARIKEPGGESVARQVVRLSFQIGDRKLRGDFSLNNRHNMLAPVLIGRSLIKELGWVDASRTHLADQKLFR